MAAKTRGKALFGPARVSSRAGRPEPTTDEGVTPGGSEADVAHLEITDVIDLHGFQPRDALDVVESYLEAAQEQGLTEVRIVHGRGTGAQRARVQAWLRASPRVLSFADAPPHRGGWGATLAWLSPGTPRTAPSVEPRETPADHAEAASRRNRKPTRDE